MEPILVTRRAIPVAEGMQWLAGKRLSWACMICMAMCGSGAGIHGRRILTVTGLTAFWTLCLLPVSAACNAAARGSATPPFAALRIASGSIPALATGSLVFVWVCFRSRASQSKLKNSSKASRCVRGRPARRDDEWAACVRSGGPARLSQTQRYCKLS